MQIISQHLFFGSVNIWLNTKRKLTFTLVVSLYKKRAMDSLLSLVFYFFAFASTAIANKSSSCQNSNPIYSFMLKDIDKKQVSWNGYKNKVLLITNVATYWGYTKRDYGQLNAIMASRNKKFGACTFEILGFPCNQFGHQEPGESAAEIMNGLKYVRPGEGFVPAFQLFQKGDVNGEKENPMFTHLKVIVKLSANIQAILRQILYLLLFLARQSICFSYLPSDIFNKTAFILKGN